MTSLNIQTHKTHCQNIIFGVLRDKGPKLDQSFRLYTEPLQGIMDGRQGKKNPDPATIEGTHLIYI